MIKFLLDQGLPRSAASALGELGFDAIHVGEVNLSRARDQEILEFARSENRVCCTLDADFHRCLAVDRMPTPSVIGTGGEIRPLCAAETRPPRRSICPPPGGQCPLTNQSLFQLLPAGNRGRFKPSCRGRFTPAFPVIRIRIEGLKGNETAAPLARLAETLETELISGSALSVTRKSVRVRRLPIGSKPA